MSLTGLLHTEIMDMCMVFYFFSVVWGVVIMAVFLLPVVSSARVFNAIETVFGAASDSLISWHQWLGHTCGQRSAENQHNADVHH